MSRLRERVNAELKQLVEKHGTLKQQHVVKAARDKETALYEEFERHGLWDDKKAAEIARLEYAGRLIRTYTIRITDDQKEPVRALVSLVSDRKTKSGLPGYRPIESVMGDEALKDGLIQTALMELRAFKRKYEHVRELAAVWDAIQAADAKYSHSALSQAETESRASA